MWEALHGQISNFVPALHRQHQPPKADRLIAMLEGMREYQRHMLAQALTAAPAAFNKSL